MLRIYLIGAGAIARYHAQALDKLSHQVSLAVTDANVATLKDFQKQFPHARLYSDVNSMLNEPARASDIVVLATPPLTHCELAHKALRTKRHVLSEKPLAINSREAQSMLNLAREVKRVLGCCSNRFLGLPTTERVKELIRSNALGKLYHVTFVNRRQRARTGIDYQPTTLWFLDRSKNGGGALMDWGPYDFTVLNDVLLPTKVEVVNAWSATPFTHLELPEGTVNDVEQHIGAALKYYLDDEQVVEVTYERSACTHGGERTFSEIEGERGALSWNWLCMSGEKDVVHSYDKGGQVEVEKTIYEADGELGLMDKPLVYFYRHLHGDTSPALINEQAVFNFLCLKALYDCIETGKPQIVPRRDS